MGPLEARLTRHGYARVVSIAAVATVLAAVCFPGLVDRIANSDPAMLIAFMWLGWLVAAILRLPDRG